MLRGLLFLAFAGAACAQSPDAVLTQTLINEIRALRQDLEATNVTAQRVQIALYRLQSQTVLVNAAQQRLDAARTRAAEAEVQQQRLNGQMQAMEEAARAAGESQEKKEAAANLPRIRQVVEATAAEVSSLRAALADAESQYRAEQARLADLQALLDRLDKALDELARGKK